MNGDIIMDLSVAIVAYNNYDDVIKAIDSIEEYTSSDVSKLIYIIDNSANNKKKDKSRKSMLCEISKYTDVKYLDTGDNLGFGRGNNFVISTLESRYHAIVNPDVILKEDSFSKIMEYMEQNSDIGMCIPKIVDMDGNLQLVYRRELSIIDLIVRYLCPNICKKRYKAHTMQDMDYTKPFQVPFGQGSFLVIRTKLFQKLEGFDERFFMYVEDADFCKRVNQVSKFMYFPDTLVVHKWERSSHKNMKLFFWHFKSIIQYFYKWGITAGNNKNDNLKQESSIW